MSRLTFRNSQGALEVVHEAVFLLVIPNRIILRARRRNGRDARPR